MPCALGSRNLTVIYMISAVRGDRVLFDAGLVRVPPIEPYALILSRS